MSDFSDLASSAVSKVVGGSLNSIESSIASGVNTLESLKSPIGNSWSLQGDVPGGDAGKERLYAIRPRSYGSSFSQSKNAGFKYTSDRGPIASIRLLSSNNDPLGSRNFVLTDKTAKDAKDLLGGNASGAPYYSRFLLTDVQVTYNEKMQIYTTFGDNEVAYFFGKQPVMFNISGLLFDSIENDWFSRWIDLYQNVFRGTQLAQNAELLQLILPNMSLTGSITALSITQNAGRDTDIGFSFSFLAKEFTPLAVPNPRDDKLSFNPLGGQMIDWSVGKAGVGGSGYSLSIGTLGGGFSSSFSNTVDSIVADIGSLTSGVTSAVDSFRKSIFSPIYGVITSIAKVVKKVTGSIDSLISSFTSPVTSILRDINQIFSVAASIGTMIENTVANVISIPGRAVANIDQQLRQLKATVGVISRIPEDISQVMQRHVQTGRINAGSAILSSGNKRKKSKAPLLNSGKPYVPSSGTLSL